MVKVLNLFGLQLNIRSDIATWSPALHKTFIYFADKKNTDNKVEAMDVLEVLLNKTNHSSYFGKSSFGGKTYIRQFNNPTLYLVVLIWLHQLQQCFFWYNAMQNNKDWNKYGRYCGTASKVKANGPTLANINKATVRNKAPTLVDDLKYFKPNGIRNNVVTSLEEWAAKILEPDFAQSLAEAKNDKDTRSRFAHANEPTEFFLTEDDYKTTLVDESDDQLTICTSPDKHKHEPKGQLLLIVTTGLKSNLLPAQKKKANTEKNSSVVKLVSFNLLVTLFLC